MNYPVPQVINGNEFDEESPGRHCTSSSFRADLAQLGLVINTRIFNDLFLCVSPHQTVGHLMSLGRHVYVLRMWANFNLSMSQELRSDLVLKSWKKCFLNV